MQDEDELAELGELDLDAEMDKEDDLDDDFPAETTEEEEM